MNWGEVAELAAESFPKMFMAGLTMTLALISFILAMLIAIACAMIQYARIPVAQRFVQFYIWIFRGTPMLVQLFIMYFGMQSIGIRITAVTAAVIVFSLNTGAIVRKRSEVPLKGSRKDNLKQGTVRE